MNVENQICVFIRAGFDHHIKRGMNIIVERDDTSRKSEETLNKLEERI